MTYNLGKVKGPAGKGITSITKTGTSGLIDTYTITYTDGTTSTFTVTNGDSGADISTTWGNPTSNSKVASEKLTKDTLDTKASTVHLHGNITSDGKIGSTSGKVIVTGTSGVLEASSQSFPTKVSDLTNDTGFVTENHNHSISQVTNLQTVLDGKASSTHSHSISDVTNLQTSLDAKVNTSDIANNLTTTASGKVLDARQGKALKDYVDGLVGDIEEDMLQ